MSDDESSGTSRSKRRDHKIRLKDGDGPHEHFEDNFEKLREKMGLFPAQFLDGEFSLVRDGYWHESDVQTWARRPVRQGKEQRQVREEIRL